MAAEFIYLNPEPIRLSCVGCSASDISSTSPKSPKSFQSY